MHFTMQWFKPHGCFLGKKRIKRVSLEKSQRIEIPVAVVPSLILDFLAPARHHLSPPSAVEPFSLHKTHCNELSASAQISIVSLSPKKRKVEFNVIKEGS